MRRATRWLKLYTECIRYSQWKTHYMDSILNYIAMSIIAFTHKAISQISRKFQIISQQPDDGLLWNLLCGKVKGSYFDFWH